VIVGSMMAMSAFGLLAGGLGLRIADTVMRDNQGYLMSSTERYDSPGIAVTSQNVELTSGSASFDVANRFLGTVKIEAESRTPEAIFVGVARTSDVDAYLRGVAHTTVTDPSGNNGDPQTTYVDGSTTAQRPGDENFWVASSEGAGKQVLTWEPEDGEWTFVVMNAEGTSPVRAQVAVGAEVPILDNIAIGLLISGLVLLGFAVLVLWLAIRRRSTP
jgi:hypothetical protein